jgi:hypothetical protein
VSLTGAGTSSVRRREILLVVGFAAVTLTAGLGVAGVVADAYSQPPRGLSYHAFFAVASSVGVSPGGAVVFAATLLTGLFVLVACDRYRRFTGLVLLAVGVGGLVLLTDAGLARVDWAAHTPAALLGLTAGLVGGGLTLRGGPGHAVFDTTGSDSRLEFPRAIPRLFVLLSALTVVAVVESTVVYDSPVVYRDGAVVNQQFTFRAVTAAGLPLDAAAAVVFLGVVWLFRDATAEREVTLLGATGAGKTAVMAGLAASVDDYAGGQYTLDAPLRRLRADLDERGTFPSTPRTAAVPLRMTFRHGWLLPRKVTVRTLDYAGNHLDKFSPIDPSATATADADEVFAVARHLYNTRAAADPDRSPLDDPGRNPDDVPGLAELADDEIVPQLLRDLVAHSDGVGLLYPMDDFAAPAVRAGCQPPYVDVDGVEVVNPRNREAYQSTFRAVVDAYGTQTDLFAVATKADIVRRYCTDVADADPLHDWDGFGETIARTCVGDELPASLRRELLPVHFAVSGRRDGETVLAADSDDGQYPLRGAGHLLDRVGDWWPSRLGSDRPW